MSGTRISTKSGWACRRAEISAEAQQFEFGTKPPPPAGVMGSANGNNIVVNVSNGGKSILVYRHRDSADDRNRPLPRDESRFGGISLNARTLAQQGVAIVTFPNDDIAAQSSASSRGQGSL